MISILCFIGCNVNLIKTGQAVTPLCQATAELSQEMVRLLVESGAHMDQASAEDGNTPLCLLVLASRHTSHPGVTAQRKDAGNLETACNIISYLGQ